MLKIEIISKKEPKNEVKFFNILPELLLPFIFQFLSFSKIYHSKNLQTVIDNKHTKKSKSAHAEAINR